MTETSAASSIIRCVDLWRTYQMGEETIHALRGVTFEVCQITLRNRGDPPAGLDAVVRLPLADNPRR